MEAVDFYAKLESKDLAIPERMTYHILDEWPLSRVVDMVLELSELVPISPPHPSHDGTLNILPDHITSGYGCISPECRTIAAQELGVLSGLYFDTTYVTSCFHVSSSYMDAEHLNRADDLYLRERVAGDICWLMRAKPLIEAGIIRLIEPMICLCPGCRQKYIPASAEAAISELAEKMTDRLISNCSISITRFIVKRQIYYGLCMEGPSDLLPDGALRAMRNPREVPLLVRKLCPAKGKVTLDASTAKKSMIPQGAVEDAMREVIFGLLASRLYDVNYLTQQTIDRYFLRAAGAKDSERAQQAKIAARLAHRLPVVRDVPLRQIVEIRNTEPEAFISYRRGITSGIDHLSGTGAPISENDMDEFYSDCIAPEILRIEAQFQRERKRRFASAGRTALVYSAAVGLGLAMGILPPTAATILGAVGGAQAADAIIKGAIEAIDIPQSIRASDFYLLWRISRGRKRNCAHR